MAKPLDVDIEAVLEVYEGVLGPEPLLQLFASDQLSRLFKKDGKNMERLLFDPDFVPALEELPGFEVNLKHPETDQPGTNHRCHGRPLLHVRRAGRAR